MLHTPALFPSLNPLALGMPMGAEWLVIAALGLLIFGKRLPEVGKGIGQAIRSFKQGLNTAEEEPVEVETPTSHRLTSEATAPAGSLENKTEYKFDPYTGKPIEQPKPKFDPYTGKAIEQEQESGTQGA